MASVKPDVQLYSSGINPNAWVKDTEFWSQDGNVVLFAQDRGFRVRHDNLMFQSEILGACTIRLFWILLPTLRAALWCIYRVLHGRCGRCWQ